MNLLHPLLQVFPKRLQVVVKEIIKEAGREAETLHSKIDRLLKDNAEIEMERNFYRDQFEQVQSRLEKLQGSL